MPSASSEEVYSGQLPRMEQRPVDIVAAGDYFFWKESGPASGGRGSGGDVIKPRENTRLWSTT